MIWQCKLCSASFTDRLQVFKHYRLQHSHFSSVSPLPCIYNDCMCTFKTLNSLRTHLSRYHTRQFGSSAEHSQQALLFKCPLCPFQQQFSESVLFCHLRRHLRNHETVACPYKDCSFTTNVYSSFNSHKVDHTKQVFHQTFKMTLSVKLVKPVFLQLMVICMKNLQAQMRIQWGMMVSVTLTN